MSPGYGFLLRPGRFVLCRTYERFSMPNDLCGRLVGRSSMGRLGLSVAAGANLVNPGWQGHMPVMIVNHSPFAVRLYPYLGVVQLCLIPMHPAPMKAYGDDGVGSKYIDDEGGPSRYWLDYTIAALRNDLQLKNSSSAAEAFLERYAKELDDPTRARLIKAIGKRGFIDDGADFARSFVQLERRRNALTWLWGMGASAVVSIAIRWAPWVWGAGEIGWMAAILWSIVLCVIFILLYRRQFGTTMSLNDLRKLIAEVDARPK